MTIDQPTEYDIRRAAEKAATAARAAAFRTVAAAVARELTAIDGGPWALAPRRVHDMGEELSPELTHDDERIHLTNGGYRLAGRIGVSGAYPRLPDGSGWSSRGLNLPDENITISADKTPAQIARDIARRCLPHYRARMAAARAACDRQAQRTNTTIATFDRLVAAGGLEADHNSRGDRRANLGDRELTATIRAGEGVSGSIRVSGDSVYFERLSVTGDVAARVIAALRGRCR